MNKTAKIDAINKKLHLRRTKTRGDIRERRLVEYIDTLSFFLGKDASDDDVNRFIREWKDRTVSLSRQPVHFVDKVYDIIFNL